MDNFKFTASNGIQTNVKEVLNIFTPGTLNGFGNFTNLITQPTEDVSVDQTDGQAGIGTTNNSYTRNGVDIFSQNDSFNAPYVFKSTYGPLAKYDFFEDPDHTYNINIPSWASYLRVFLIGGGGGSNIDYGGGAGEFLLKQIGPLSGTNNSYRIIIGKGGTSTYSTFTPGSGESTWFYLNQEYAPRARAFGGAGPVSAGDGPGYGGGSNSEDLTEVRGKGNDGGANNVGYQYGGSGTVTGVDRHYGFLVGAHSEVSGEGIVFEMSGEINYGGGGNSTSTSDLPYSGTHGCACVFYFAGKPPDWNLSGSPVYIEYPNGGSVE